MKLLVPVGLLVIASAFAQSGPPDNDVLIGLWEGESVCQVPKPCTTEHVIYDVKRGEAGKFAVTMDKVVNGSRETMGTLDCAWAASERRLTCPMSGRRPGIWTFDLKQDTLDGTLKVQDDNLVFRKINVKKISRGVVQ